MNAAPVELSRLRTRMAELADLRQIGYLLFWDQNTMMPPGGSGSRGHQSATLATLAHERTADPEVGRLLDALAPWAADQDPDGADARCVQWLRRDFEKAVLVPGELAAEMSRAAAVGQTAWQAARAAHDFGRFRDALAHHVELRHRYATCFPSAAHPYDALLDDFEPGLTTAELTPLFSELTDALVPLVALAGDARGPRHGGVLAGPYSAAEQEATVTRILTDLGFDRQSWRLDPSPHPFAQPVGPTDMRITTRYDDNDLGVALYMALHEFGHGLYDSQIAPELVRTVLGDGASFGFHESQSRMFENFVGRSRGFTRWLHGRLDELLPDGFGRVDADGLYRAVNTVRPSAVRVEADEVTYNLHIVLRFEIERGLVDGTLAVDDVPEAWEKGMEELLRVRVPGPALGALQDIHWGSGMIGYFPGYAIGNMIAAQLWRRIAVELPGLDEHLERGDVVPLRDWLATNVHRHGRTFGPRELLHRITGEHLQVAPLIDHLRERLADSGVLPTATTRTSP